MSTNKVKNLYSQVNEQLTYRQMQQLIQDIPVMFKGLYQQMDALRKLTEMQNKTLTSYVESEKEMAYKNNAWLMNIHDRLDTLIVETRVSNMLMSEFLELQKTIIKEEVADKAKDHRAELYYQARNGG